MSRFRLILITIILVAAGAVLFKQSSQAQEQPFNLITSPLPINLTTTPGKPVSADLRVKNNSSTPEKLKTSLYKFAVNEQSEVTLSESDSADDSLDWVSFIPAVFDAPPNEWQTVKMNIDVPETAGLGYYYAVAFSRAEAPTPVPSGAALRGQVITFVLLDVQVPNAKRELTVTEFSSDRSVYEFLPATFTVKVKNTGNIHLAPSGTIFIARGGQTVATLSVNPGQGNILPNSTRTFKAEWDDGFPAYVTKIVDGQPVANPDTTTAKELKWDFDNPLSKFRIGKYSAKLIMVYDDGQRDVPIEGTVGIWIIPWRILAVLILLIGFLGFFVYRYRRLKKRLNSLQAKEKKG